MRRSRNAGLIIMAPADMYVFVPRISSCRQVNHSWSIISFSLCSPVVKSIIHVAVGANVCVGWEEG